MHSQIKIKCIILLIACFSIISLRAEIITLDSWRWSRQKFEIMPAANLGHAVSSALLAHSIEKAGLKWWQADLLSFGIGMTWEIKDAYVWYEHNGLIGGEGFSKMDLISDASGIVINRMLTFAINRIFKKKRYEISGMSVFSIR